MPIMSQSHNGLKPIEIRIGETIETTTKIISIKSRKKPRKKMIAIMISIAEMAPPGRFIKNS